MSKATLFFFFFFFFFYRCSHDVEAIALIWVLFAVKAAWLIPAFGSCQVCTEPCTAAKLGNATKFLKSSTKWVKRSLTLHQTTIKAPHSEYAGFICISVSTTVAFQVRTAISAIRVLL